MKDFKNKYFEIVKIIELPCLNFSAYEAVKVLEDSISLRDAKLHHSALEKFAEIIKGADNRDYYFSELIKLAIESKSEPILKSTMITFGEKLNSYYISRIIKHTMELGDDNKVLELVWDKFANQIDGYYARELILEFIEKNNIQLLEKFVAISANKLSSSHVYEIIEQAIRINNDEVFKFIWEKLSSNLDTYDANLLMEELIAAKNTELLNLITDKLTDIIKSGTIGDYYLKKLFDKAITSDEPQIAKLIATALVGKIGISYVNTIIKYAVDTNDNALLEEIISICRENLDSSGIQIVIQYAVSTKDKNYIGNLLSTFQEKLSDDHLKDILEFCIKARDISLIEHILKFIDCDKFKYLQSAVTCAIEINEHQIFDILWDKFSEKIEKSSDMHGLINAAIKSKNMGFFHIIWDKFANQIDGSDAKQLMKELIDAKNTELLNLITDKLIDIIKSDDSGEYRLKDILEFCIKARDISLIEHILKFIDCDKFKYLQSAVTCAIEINEHQIFDILWGKFSEKIEEPSDIRILIKAAIKSENMEFFHIIWDKFSEKIPNHHKKSVIDVALKSENEFKIDTVVKKYIGGNYSASENKFLIQNLLKSKQDVISKEIKILFSKLLLKVKTVDFESLEYFYQNDALYEKDGNGFPLAYYLSQKEVDISSRKLLDSMDINKYLPEGSSVFSRSSSYKYYVNKEASKSIMIVTGEDHNGAFNYDKINKYLNKGFNITTIDHRNEKDVCLKNHLFDYYSYLQEQSIDLYYSDLLILNRHGGIGGKSGKHTIERDGMGARTFEYLKDLTEKFEDKPVKVLLTACFGQAALLDSIEILPNGSEMLTISEYRKVGDKIKEINNDRGINTNYVANLSQRTDLSASDVLKLENIAYLHIKGYQHNKPSPAYAKKDKDGNIKMFSCIEKLEDLIEGKIDLSYIMSIQQSFITKYCGNEDIICINKSSSIIEKTLDSIKYMHMLNLGYKYHAEEVSEKLLDRSEYSHSFDYFNVNLALSCQIGFSEINGDFEE